MFWRKVFHVLVISILLMGAVVVPTAAEESKSLSKNPIIKQPNATYTVCASGCDFSSIQTAIDTVNPGDTLSLAGETFTESITIDKDLTIQGAGAESTIVQAAAAPGIATSRVVTVTNSISVTISDLTIRHGNYQSPVGTSPGGAGIHNQGDLEIEDCTISDNETNAYGGGIYNDSNSNLIMTDVIFADNSAYNGGGLYTFESNPELMGITFSSNSVFGFGGGMLNSGGSPILASVTFTGNLAEQGGGMVNDGGNPLLIDVIFSDNSADAGIGGGMLNFNSSPTLTNVTFSQNSANSGNNGSGGGMYNESNSNPVLTNVTFSENSAHYNGGGMANDGSNPTLIKVIFTNNTGSGVAGGGMSNIASNPSLINVIFSNNSGQVGGGIHNDNHSSPSLVNVTFSGNSASYGGGLYNTWESNPSLTNVIMWGNSATYSGDQISNDNSAPVISYTLIQDSGGSGASWDSSLGTDGGGNIDADPLFVDPTNDNLHSGAGSPAIDNGDDLICPPTDLDGVPRPQGEGCDIGAYEFIGILLEKQVNTIIPIPGETITFTIQVSNNLTESITGGQISDTLPTGLNFIGPIALEPPLSGTVGSAIPILVTDLEIGAGQQVTVTFPVSVALDVPIGTVITNTAWITANEVITPILGSTEITVISGTPVAVDDSGPAYTTDEKSGFITGNVLDNDYDPKGDPLYLLSYDDSSLVGLLTSLGDGTFNYDPNGQFDYLAGGEQAYDVFTYVVTDGVLTDTATVTITIEGVNDPPVAIDDAGPEYSTDEATAFTTGNVLDNDYDFDLSDVLSVDGFDDSSLLGLLNDNGDGTFGYDPNGQFEDLAPGEQAEDPFTYIVSDGVLTDTATVTITINGVNDAPIIDAGPDQTVDEGTLVQFTGSYTDPDDADPVIHWNFGDGASATDILTPTHTYPDNGVFTVTLTVTDTFGAVASDWSIVTVENVAPILGAFPDLETAAGETITVTGTITDPGLLDSQSVVITWGDGLTETLQLEAPERQFTVTHAYAEAGEYTATIRVTDKDGGWNERSFSVHVCTTGYQIYLPLTQR